MLTRPTAGARAGASGRETRLDRLFSRPLHALAAPLLPQLAATSMSAIEGALSPMNKRAKVVASPAGSATAQSPFGTLSVDVFAEELEDDL